MLVRKSLKKTTKRKIENIVCKLGRKIRNSDQLYYDIVDKKFPLVTYEDGIVSFEKNGKILLKSNKGLIENIESLEKYQHTFNHPNDNWMKEFK